VRRGGAGGAGDHRCVDAADAGQDRDAGRRARSGQGQAGRSRGGAVQAQVRQLAEDNQALKEKLQASRDNNRFLGKRIADLEPEVCE